MSSDLVVIIGLGEVGKPMGRILGRTYQCREVDIDPVEVSGHCSVLHVCYPFQICDFVGTTVQYIARYKPDLTIINSTVAPGTTKAVYEASGHRPTAYSPVRGKHAHMDRDMLRYTKFVAGCDAPSTFEAAAHFSRAGFRTAVFTTPTIGEICKLLETTYLGVLVGWAQEMERIAQAAGGQFSDVRAFIEEVDFLPSHILPGIIGGHCVMPNISILQQHNPSALFLPAVVESNKLKRQQSTEARQGTHPCSTSV